MQIKARICDGKIVEIWIITGVAEDGFAEDYNPYHDKRGRFAKAPHAVDKEKFCELLGKARASQPPDKAWRVDPQTVESINTNHPNAKFYATELESVFGVDANGDIFGVCMHSDDDIEGHMLLKMAIDRGGTKLDSYGGNHKFYVRNGFLPVSWCEFNEEYVKHLGWRKGIDDPEPVIFYKYIGIDNARHKEAMEKYYPDWENFTKDISPHKEYEDAQEYRDKEMKK